MSESDAEKLAECVNITLEDSYANAEVVDESTVCVNTAELGPYKVLTVIKDVYGDADSFSEKVVSTINSLLNEDWSYGENFVVRESEDGTLADASELHLDIK